MLMEPFSIMILYIMFIIFSVQLLMKTLTYITVLYEIGTPYEKMLF